MNTLCKVTVAKLNRRSYVPLSLPDNKGINGTVIKGFEFNATEVVPINPELGKWYKDKDNNFYWGGGLIVNPSPVLTPTEIDETTKLKIMRVVNMFETGTPDGNYGLLVTYKDYTNPLTKKLEIQITYGRSQTTEFGHLRTLIVDYVNKNGIEAEILRPYLNRIGQQPSLSNDTKFKNALKRAGNDPVMKNCQDQLFETKYYAPSFRWHTRNGFTLPLSLLVIYDSYIHSGGILAFLRNRMKTKYPIQGGDQQEWITEYIAVRDRWLANHSNPLLRKTLYRTVCFREQVQLDNWMLDKPINANGRIIV